MVRKKVQKKAVIASLPTPSPERKETSISLDKTEDLFRDEYGNFQLPSGYEDHMPDEEREERLRCIEADIDGLNINFILRLCEKLRDDLWKCQRATEEDLKLGCRNYLINLEFEDGVQWLMKMAQPAYQWQS